MNNNNNIKITKEFFDKVYDRRNSGSIKYDMKPKGITSNNLIPMWVADMDFKIPPAVENALEKVTSHGFLGYTDEGEDFNKIICGWYRRRMGWMIEPEWIIKIPGVMFGISAAIRALTQPEDAIIICQPVYYPFERVVTANSRRVVISNLEMLNGVYRFDFEDFEKKIEENNVKMFLLCSPHNPVSRVWSEEELRRIGEICLKHGVIIVSDEIHCDFIFKGHHHVPISTISPDIADITVTLVAPTKTFNLAGLQSASIVVSNKVLRDKISKSCLETEYNSLNIMAIAATKAAYLYGDEWLVELISYLEGNVEILRKAFPSDGDISLINPEGTYLMWLDCRKVRLSDSELKKLLLEKAEVWLHSGSTFGESGRGFLRINIACPRSVLEEAIRRIKAAL